MLILSATHVHAATIHYDLSGTLNGANVNGTLAVDDQTHEILTWAVSVDAGPADSGNQTLNAYTFSNKAGDSSLSNADGISLRGFAPNPNAAPGSNDNRDFRIDIPVAQLVAVRQGVSQAAITDCWNCSPFRTGTVLLTAKAKAAARAAANVVDLPPRIDSASFCIGPDGFEFAVVVAGTSQPDFAFRFSADNEAFASPTERFEVNFDAGGSISRGVNATVATAGTARFDRWQDGPVSPFTLTPLGNNSYRLGGQIAAGSQPFAIGDSVSQVGFRSFGVASRTAMLASVSIEACADAAGLR